MKNYTIKNNFFFDISNNTLMFTRLPTTKSPLPSDAVITKTELDDHHRRGGYRCG